MPWGELNLFGFLLSPIFAMILVAAACTSVLARVIDRIIPYSMARNEGLLCILCFVAVLAGMANFTF